MGEYEQRLTRLVKGGTLSTVGNFLTIFSNTLSAIFITHLFRSPALFGLYDLAFRLTFFLRALVLAGTDHGMKRFLPIYRLDGNRAAVKGLLLYSLRITAILSVIIVAGLLIFAPTIAALFQKPDAVYFIRVLALSIPSFAFLLVLVSSLTAIHQVKYQVLIERVLVPGIRLVVLFAFLFVGYKTLRRLAVVWSLPIAFAIGCSIASYFFLKIFHVLRDDEIRPQYHGRELIKFSLPLAANRPLLYLMNFVGTFIIAYYLTEADIGQYGIVTRLGPLLLVPLQSAVLVFAPFISELHHTGKLDELEKHFKFISKWIFAFSLYIFLTYVLLTKQVLMLFGHDYSVTETQHALLLVSLAQLFSAAVGPVGLLLSMTGKPRLVLYNTLIMLAVNITLGLVLIPLESTIGGIVGAGIGLGIAIFGVNILFLLQVRHCLKMHPFSIGYFKPLVAGLQSWGILYGLIRLTGVNAIFEKTNPGGSIGYFSVVGYILAVMAVLAAFYALFIYLLGLDETDKFILRKMFSKLRRTTPTNSTTDEQ